MKNLIAKIFFLLALACAASAQTASNTFSVELTTAAVTATIDGAISASPVIIVKNNVIPISIYLKSSTVDVTASMGGQSSAALNVQLLNSAGAVAGSAIARLDSGIARAEFPFTQELSRAIFALAAAGSTSASVTLVFDYSPPTGARVSSSIACTVSIGGYVSVSTQALTSAQQAVARGNIGAVAVEQLACSQLGPVGVNLSNGTDLKTSYRMQHTFPRYTTGIRMRFGNYQVANGTDVESGPGNTVVVTAAVEYNGINYPVQWNGVASYTMLDGGVTPLSDPLPIDVAAGDSIYGRYCPTVTSTQKWVNTTQQRASTDSYTIGSDITASTGAMASTATTGSWPGFGPIEVTGRVYGDSVSVLGIGDSIMRGSADSINRPGYFARAMGDSVAWLNMGVGGTTQASRLPSTGHVRQRLLSYGLARYVVIQLGVNDVAGGTSLATMQANYLTLANQFVKRGAKVYGCTLLPYTTASSDGYITASGQTVSAFEANKVAFNNWLRTIPSPLSGVFDPAILIEVNSSNVLTLNGGRWLVTGGVAPTADGTHPTTAVHAVLAAAVNVSVFQ